MKTAYFDCFSGISGDMILGAMLDAGASLDKLREGLACLNLDGFTVSASTVLKKGIKATKADVIIESPDLPDRPLKNIRQIINDSTLDADIKNRSLYILQRLAEAEAVVHNCAVEDVHFHEVGHIDTIVDIVGSVICLQLLGIEKVIASPIDTGGGHVKIAHGTFSIPAPAVAELLKGVPVYSSGVQRELTTPTGAAIITTIASSFGPLPQMKLLSTGYGAGGWDLSEKANILRVFIGEDQYSNEEDEVLVIETNIDDMNPQIYEYVIEKLLQAGALDVYLTQTIMKKSRPGHLLSIIAGLDKLDIIKQIIFQETTTIGIRISKTGRSTLKREIKEIELPQGRVRVKVSGSSESIINIVPEYEDCKRLAHETGLPLKDIIELAKRYAEGG
ncbi:MAG: nickel pincer cofactor biosynthesis protein LarC [Nitrospirae bacterium]|nr:nickel pincer cofactor biosynthesis protein LarC [Nitrospirota bacterium]